MMINRLLISATKKLQSATEVKINNIKNPHLEAELLLSNILRVSREHILSHQDKKLNLLQIINYKLQILRLSRGTPLAYIVKNKQFYGYNFFVNRHVLIPRPETELMIDEAILHITQHVAHSMECTIIDIGTGSGCIPIVLAKGLNKNRFHNPNFMIQAIDISKKTLKIAKKNAKFHQMQNIKFYQGNLLEPVIPEIEKIDNIIITANLPYLTPKQLKNSPSIQKEPKLALVAGTDGLKYYKKLFEQIKQFNNKNITIFCEIDHSQAKNISKLIKQTLVKYNFEIKKDLRDHDRLVVIKKAVL